MKSKSWLKKIIVVVVAITLFSLGFFLVEHAAADSVSAYVGLFDQFANPQWNWETQTYNPGTHAEVEVEDQDKQLYGKATATVFDDYSGVGCYSQAQDHDVSSDLRGFKYATAYSNARQFVDITVT